MVKDLVFLLLISIAPKLMSLTGKIAYLLYTERALILTGMLAMVSPVSPRCGSMIYKPKEQLMSFYYQYS